AVVGIRFHGARWSRGRGGRVGRVLGVEGPPDGGVAVDVGESLPAPVRTVVEAEVHLRSAGLTQLVPREIPPMPLVGVGHVRGDVATVDGDDAAVGVLVEVIVLLVELRAPADLPHLFVGEVVGVRAGVDRRLLQGLGWSPDGETGGQGEAGRTGEDAEGGT